MKRQGGFTLIELVVVIVILGILAVTAAPKFLNLQGDARASSLQGLKGAMSGAAGIVYGKAAINGVEGDENPTALVGGVKVNFGYPKASDDGIETAVIGLAEDWAQVSGTNDAQPADTATYYFQGATQPDKVDAGCYVRYAEATSAAAPIITIIDEGC